MDNVIKHAELARNCAVPLWNQVAERLEATARDLAPGARFPSERELCTQYRVQRGTVQKAIDHLVARRVLSRSPSVGTFVQGASETAPIALLQFHLPSADDVVYTTHIRGICKGLEGTGRALLPSLIMPGGPSSEMIGAALHAAQVAGIIVDRFVVPDDVPFILGLHRDFPIVTMSKELVEAPMPCVQADPFQSTAQLARLLVEQGCRTLMVVNRTSNNTVMRRRCESFVSAMAALGFPDVPILSAASMVEERLKGGVPGPVGVLAPLLGDANRVRDVGARLGLRMGADLFVAAFPASYDRERFPDMFRAVRDEERLGFESARMLLRLMNGACDAREVVNVPCEIVKPEERDSGALSTAVASSGVWPERE